MEEIREIKVRGWNIRKKVMEYEPGMPVSLYTDFHLELSEYLDWLQDEYDLMLYTGLKDRNGKEIYERDIVEADWGYGCPRVKVELETIYYAKGECCISNEIEVIGDSYQNPELLKENK